MDSFIYQIVISSKLIWVVSCSLPPNSHLCVPCTWGNCVEREWKGCFHFHVARGFAAASLLGNFKNRTECWCNLKARYWIINFFPTFSTAQDGVTRGWRCCRSSYSLSRLQNPLDALTSPITFLLDLGFTHFVGFFVLGKFCRWGSSRAINLHQEIKEMQLAEFDRVE